MIWAVTRTYAGITHSTEAVNKFYGQENDEFHVACAYSEWCEERHRGSTGYYLHNQRGEIVGHPHYCCSERNDSWIVTAAQLTGNIIVEQTKITSNVSSQRSRAKDVICNR